MENSITTDEARSTKELGDPFRRDAMKFCEVAGINKGR
jgi:hypothetical protein